MVTQKTVNLGLIGRGPVWDERYRPAIESLGKRLVVRAVYDAVDARAEQFSRELDCLKSSGVVALAEMNAVDSVLVLDAGWHKTGALELLAGVGKPVYLSGSLGRDARRVAQVRERAGASGASIMPELSRRFTPATGRLKELIASRIGRPLAICINAVLPSGDDDHAVPGQTDRTDFLIGLADWCRYVVGAPPVGVGPGATSNDEAAGGEVVAGRASIQFQPPRTGEAEPTVELVLSRNDCRKTERRIEPGTATFEVVCQSGSARLDDERSVVWQSDDATKPVSETLAADRTEVVVMLDLFCRRVLGGLIPLPGIEDVERALDLVQAIEREIETVAATSA